MDAIKITSLRLENVKRVRAVQLTPQADGLTVIGGRNGQGKTSVLDAIAWALGGDRYKPTNAQREGSVLPPDLEVTLSNGLVVQRKGKSSSLTVTDSTGKRAGQALLNEFVSQFAIDLPKFLEASDKDKAEALLQIIGVGEQLHELETKENTAYNKRHYLGQIADQKEKHAKELPSYDGVPEAPVSAAELIQRQQAIIMQNAENQRMRTVAEQLAERRIHQKNVVEDLKERLDRAQELLDQLTAERDAAADAASKAVDEPTDALEADIQRVDEINRQVRANLDKAAAIEEALRHRKEYNDLTAAIDQIRRDRMALLDKADMPLEGLSVEGGKLLYRGKAWDCMSGAEQLIVGTSIAMAIKPECGFVLLDKLEQMDKETLDEFGEWLEDHHLQGIATRVSTGEECTLIIEDGVVKQETVAWQPGKF